MNKETYNIIKNYMLEMNRDSAHDSLHVYRVLYQALNISKAYDEVNMDVLVASCLLHDIGRDIQFQNSQLCHAIEGGKMAYAFIKGLGWGEDICKHIQDCITTHRFRMNKPPQTIEAKILFDSDKLDVTGALGIARSLMYKGQVKEPLYTVDERNQIQDGKDLTNPESFLKEYHFKLIKLYDLFYTKEAKTIAQNRKQIATLFFNALLEEVTMDDLNELLQMELQD